MKLLVFLVVILLLLVVDILPRCQFLFLILQKIKLVNNSCNLNNIIAACDETRKFDPGRYNVRVRFQGRIPDHFDLSVQRTVINTSPQQHAGWSNLEHQNFSETQLLLDEEGELSVCLYDTGHGLPLHHTVEATRVNNFFYEIDQNNNPRDLIMKTCLRWSFGDTTDRGFASYGKDSRGVKRMWTTIPTFGGDSSAISTLPHHIRGVYAPPNFYPAGLYKSAIVSSEGAKSSDLQFTLILDDGLYSFWLHFADIRHSPPNPKMVFDIMFDEYIAFQDVDVVHPSGRMYTALVLNKTVEVKGGNLTITLKAKQGNQTLISAIEVFQIIFAEAKTLPNEVKALQRLKTQLGVSEKLGWNGDPCVPRRHPWKLVKCVFDTNSSNWVIDGLFLNGQGLKGLLQDDISFLVHLKSLNLSKNELYGPIPSSLGAIPSLRVLDLSYNSFNGSIPNTLGKLSVLQTLNLNGNSLRGRVPASVRERLRHNVSFNFSGNLGLCGIPGLLTCRPHVTTTFGVVALGLFGVFLLSGAFCCWRRSQNIQQTRMIADIEAQCAMIIANLSCWNSVTTWQDDHLA